MQAGRADKQTGRQAGMHADRQANDKADTCVGRHNKVTVVLYARRRAGRQACSQCGRQAHK